MIDLAFIVNYQAFIAIAILAIMFIGFFFEIYPPEIVAFSGAVLMLLLDIVQIEAFEIALSNPAPWTIAALFVLSSALNRTGVIALFTVKITQALQYSPKLSIFLGSFAILALSGFMNNTPVVVIMIPIVIKAAKTLGIAASKFLIPLSYLAIIGGTLTLLGTSTNLLVNGLAVEAGLRPFTIFEVTPLALCLMIVGALYIFLVAPRVLPVRSSMAELLAERKSMSFFTEVAVPEGSPVIGRNVFDVDLFKREGMRVIDVLRGDESLRRQLSGVLLEEGDRVVLKTGVNELLSIKESRALALVDKLTSKKTATVEALITPNCGLVGRRLGELRLRRRYGVYPLAVHRRAQNLGRQLDDIVIRVGDTLLLEGAPEDIGRASNDLRLLDLSETSERAYRRSKSPIVLAIWLLMLFAAGLGVVPIFFAALVSLTLVLLVHAIDLDEAVESVEGKILVLIFSMLVVGQGMQASGAVDLVVGAASPFLATLSPFMLVWALFIFTSVMTELLSNNAVAVIMAPVAIAIASSLGLDPRGLVVAVMIAASCAFATPIGYQTNTLVYSPGGYMFKDFVIVGLPLNILIGLVSSFLIPYFFPL